MQFDGINDDRLVATFLVSLLEDSFEGLTKREPCPKSCQYARSGESWICRIYIYKCTYVCIILYVYVYIIDYLGALERFEETCALRRLAAN